MKAKKYLWSLAAVYMAYLTYGIQAIVVSQNLDQFVIQWNTTPAGVYEVIAFIGLAKFLSVWLCGELSDKIGRKKMIAAGAIMYVIFFGGLLAAQSLFVASVCGFLAGLATSFFDGASYPAAQESWTAAPSSALILIKGFISVSGLVYPLLVVSLRATGAWRIGLIVPIVMSVGVLILALVAPFSYDEEKRAKKAAGQIDSGKASKQLDSDAQKAMGRFVSKPAKFVAAGCAIYGFVSMATMYSAQQLLTRYGLTVVGMDDLKAAGLTSIYTAGSLIAVILFSVLMSKFKLRTLTVLVIDLYGSILGYVLVCIVKADFAVQFAALAIGFFAAGGAMQCGVALMQELHPGNKGRNLGIYYTFMGCASYVIPKIQAVLTANVGEGQGIVNSLLLNLGLAVIGAVFMTYLALQYKKWFGVSAFSRKSAEE